MNRAPHADAAPAERDPARRAAGGVALLLLIALATFAWPAPPARPVSPDCITLRINPNTATATELRLLPGIGPALSEYILKFRESSSRRPAFRNADDLDDVYRIGPVAVERLRPLLAFDESREAAGEQQP